MINCQAPTVKGNILIVDDTPDNLRLLSSMLQSQGYKVRKAINGQMALNGAIIAPPDVILLDINMPNMNGYEVCLQLKSREQTKEIPVIFISALDDVLDKVKAFGVGGVDYITKPFQLEEVLARVTNQLSISKLQKQLREQNSLLQQEIRDRQQAESKIIELNADLQQRAVELEVLNKELEAFSYSVSHDLRAPLRRIEGFSKMLIEDYFHQLDEQGKDYIQCIITSTRRMRQLIEDLLHLSQVTRTVMNLQPVDLSATVRNIALELQNSQPERQIEFVITPNIVVEADSRLMQVVLENLLGNAWKYTAKHPRARIEFGMVNGSWVIDRGEEFDQLPTTNYQQVYFVRDDGAGFNMAYADKLFGAFQRLHSHSEFEGTGVGLAIVQRIIHRHGGRIWAKAGVEQGATFYFTLG